MNDKGTILVVDDTPTNLKLLSDVLTSHGFNVLLADSGGLALASVAVRPPELILMDMRMPGVDGLEVLRVLKAREESCDIPVMFISASEARGERLEALELGAVDFISRPIRNEELLARIRTHLDLARSRVRLEQQAAELRKVNEQLQIHLAESERSAAAMALLHQEAQASRSAALNLMDDAMESGNRLEAANRHLRREMAERRSAEAATRASEVRYRRLFESSRDGILILDAETADVVDVNPFMIELLGFSYDEFRGKKIWELGFFKDVVDSESHFADLVRNGYVRYEGIALEASDGRRVEVEFVSNVYDAGDRKVIQCNIRDISDRRRAEFALARESKRSREFLRNASDGVHILDADGTLIELSDSFAKMLGYSREELIGAHVSLWDAQWLPHEVQQKVEEQITKGDHSNFETRHRRRDGSVFDVEITGQPLELDGKTVLFNSSRDITARKQAEGALAARSCQQSAVATLGMLALSQTSLQALMEEASRVVAQTLGIPLCHVLELSRDRKTLTLRAGEWWEEDLAGHSVVDLEHGSQCGYALTTREPVVVTDLRTETRFTVSHLSIDRGVVAGMSVVIGGAETPVGVLGAHATESRAFGEDDINFLQAVANLLGEVIERRLAEESRALLATAIEQAGETIVITDIDGAIVYTNPAFEKTSGFSRDAAVGQNPRILKSGVHDAEFYHRMWSVLSRGDVWSGHITNRRKDGVLYEEEASISPVRDGEGRVVNYVAVKRDCTEEMRLADRLAQAQKMEVVGRLAAGVAHDFNNLIAVISGYGELVHRQLRGEDPLREKMEQILRAAERAAGLTRQLLAFGRKQVLQPRVLDLDVVVSGMESMLRRLIREDVELSIRIDPAAGRVKADPGQVEQVLMNLVVNARDAVPQGGRITIETHSADLDAAYAASNPPAHPGRYVVLAVTDTGSGMDQATQTRIFEPFFTTKGQGKGTGLGLSTVLGIIEQSGGFVTVSSELGVGTTFNVYLPRIDEQAPMAPEEVPHLPLRGTETVLLVEDEELLREMLSEAIESNGYSLLVAGNGAEALQVAAECTDPIHILVTDMVMPGMTGTEVAEILTRARPGMKVIFMSGYSEESAARGGQIGPGRGFLGKPFGLEPLLRKIRELLDEA